MKSGIGKRPAAETSSSRPAKISGAGKADVSTTPTSQGLDVELSSGLQALIGGCDSSATQDREGLSSSCLHSGHAPSAARLALDGTEVESGRQQSLQSMLPTMGGRPCFIFGHNGEDIMSWPVVAHCGP